MTGAVFVIVRTGGLISSVYIICVRHHSDFPQCCGVIETQTFLPLVELEAATYEVNIDPV